MEQTKYDNRREDWDELAKGARERMEERLDAEYRRYDERLSEVTAICAEYSEAICQMDIQNKHIAKAIEDGRAINGERAEIALDEGMRQDHKERIKEFAARLGADTDETDKIVFRKENAAWGVRTCAEIVSGKAFRMIIDRMNREVEARKMELEKKSAIMGEHSVYINDGWARERVDERKKHIELRDLENKPVGEIRRYLREREPLREFERLSERNKDVLRRIYTHHFDTSIDTEIQKDLDRRKLFDVSLDMDKNLVIRYNGEWDGKSRLATNGVDKATLVVSREVIEYSRNAGADEIALMIRDEMKQNAEFTGGVWIDKVYNTETRKESKPNLHKASEIREALVAHAAEYPDVKEILETVGAMVEGGVKAEKRYCAERLSIDTFLTMCENLKGKTNNKTDETLTITPTKLELGDENEAKEVAKENEKINRENSRINNLSGRIAYIRTRMYNDLHEFLDKSFDDESIIADLRKSAGYRMLSRSKKRALDSFINPKTGGDARPSDRKLARRNMLAPLDQHKAGAWSENEKNLICALSITSPVLDGVKMMFRHVNEDYNMKLKLCEAAPTDKEIPIEEYDRRTRAEVAESMVLCEAFEAVKPTMEKNNIDKNHIIELLKGYCGENIANEAVASLTRYNSLTGYIVPPRAGVDNNAVYEAEMRVVSILCDLEPMNGITKKLKEACFLDIDELRKMQEKKVEKEAKTEEAKKEAKKDEGRTRSRGGQRAKKKDKGMEI